MKTVVCPKCNGTDVSVFVPTPSEMRMGYLKTGSCTSEIGNDLRCGYISEIYNGNKPKAEITRFGVLATRYDAKDSIVNALNSVGKKQESDIVINMYKDDFYSYDHFIDLCGEYVEIIEV